MLEDWNDGKNNDQKKSQFKNWSLRVFEAEKIMLKINCRENSLVVDLGSVVGEGVDWMGSMDAGNPPLTREIS